MAYRVQVWRVLRDYFGLTATLSEEQLEAFNSVTRQIQKRKGNEYDGAIAFMLAIRNSRGGEGVESRAFINRMWSVIDTLLPQTELGTDLFSEYDYSFSESN